MAHFQKTVPVKEFWKSVIVRFWLAPCMYELSVAHQSREGNLLQFSLHDLWNADPASLPQILWHSVICTFFKQRPELRIL